VSLMDRELHKGKWTKKIGRQLAGLNVVVIGFGNIGRKVGHLLQALGARIIIVDPYLSKREEALNVKCLDEALKIADVVSIHASGEECLIGKREFTLMKEGAFILNAARGGLIDEGALRVALDNRKIAGAWFDTFHNEPYAGPLCGYQQVLLTPHIGSYTLECRREMEMESVHNLLEALSKT